MDTAVDQRVDVISGIFQIGGPAAHWFVFDSYRDVPGSIATMRELRFRVWAAIANHPAGFTSYPNVQIPLTETERRALLAFLDGHAERWSGSDGNRG